MTLMQLRCFVALAEELNFTRVAERLYVSQTSITYQIKSLEKELGVELFERSTKSVSITGAGKMIYRDIKLAIDLVDRAENLLKLSPVRPVFTIGYSFFCNGSLFQQAVSELAELHPEIDFLLEHVEPEDDLHTRLLSKRLDAVLFIDPFNTMYDDLKYYDLGGTRSAVYVSKKHRLADWQGFVGQKDIEGEKIITFAQVEARHQVMGGVPECCRLIIARDVSAAMEMVAANLGIAMFPSTCFTEPEGIVVLPSFPPPDSDRMSSRQALVCRADDKSPVPRELAKLLQSTAERGAPERCPWRNLKEE